MNMKKKLVAGGLVACLGATLIGGATLVYFTDNEEASNTFTVGNVGIDLFETKVQKVHDKWEFVPDDAHVEGNTYEGVYPGATLPKDPTVTLDAGSSNAYVRMKVTFTNGDAWQAAGVEDLRTLVSASIDPAKWSVDDGVMELATGDITFTYTYQDMLVDAEGQNSTDRLFDSVYIPAYLDGEDMAAIAEGGNFQINIKAEAIQADGFDSAAEAFTAMDNMGDQG